MLLAFSNFFMLFLELTEVSSVMHSLLVVMGQKRLYC